MTSTARKSGLCREGNLINIKIWREKRDKHTEGKRERQRDREREVYRERSRQRWTEVDK